MSIGKKRMDGVPEDSDCFTWFNFKQKKVEALLFYATECPLLRPNGLSLTFWKLGKPMADQRPFCETW